MSVVAVGGGASADVVDGGVIVERIAICIFSGRRHCC